MNQAPWHDVVAGQSDSACIDCDRGSAARPVHFLCPGSFNPLHAGHLEMVAWAETTMGGRVDFELSVVNVEKATLDVADLTQRVAQFAGIGRLWVTRAATFWEKSELFPGATFLVGADTIRRVADPQFARSSAESREQLWSKLSAAGCGFLVFGRLIDGHFRQLDDLPLPLPLRALCRGVAESEFRSDLSSTELRRKIALRSS